jgi:hypothetical protein
MSINRSLVRVEDDIGSNNHGQITYSPYVGNQYLLSSFERVKTQQHAPVQKIIHKDKNHLRLSHIENIVKGIENLEFNRSHINPYFNTKQ